MKHPVARTRQWKLTKLAVTLQIIMSLVLPSMLPSVSGLHVPSWLTLSSVMTSNQLNNVQNLSSFSQKRWMKKKRQLKFFSNKLFGMDDSLQSNDGIDASSGTAETRYFMNVQEEDDVVRNNDDEIDGGGGGGGGGGEDENNKSREVLLSAMKTLAEAVLVRV